MTTMTHKPLADEASNIADHAADTASHAIRSTQSVANAAFDRMNDKVEVARDRASPVVDRWTSQAETAVRRSVDALRDTTTQLRDQALKVSDATAGRVRDEPLKSILIAAAAGAALVALVNLFSSRTRGTGDERSCKCTRARLAALDHVHRGRGWRHHTRGTRCARRPCEPLQRLPRALVHAALCGRFGARLHRGPLRDDTLDRRCGHRHRLDLALSRTRRGASPP